MDAWTTGDVAQLLSLLEGVRQFAMVGAGALWILIGMRLCRALGAAKRIDLSEKGGTG